MLQQDYFLRLIREFTDALHLLLNKKDREQQLDEMRRMYEQYLGGPYAFWHTAKLDDVLDAISRYPESERLDRMEMLAELYYAESSLHSLPIRDGLLNKAFTIFNYCDRHSDTFSMDRRQKLADIEQRLQSLNTTVTD